jgi:outer membrane protein
MNNPFSTFSKLALALVIGLGLSSCNNNTPQNKTTAAGDSTSTSSSSGSEKIVFVNSDSLLANYGYFKEMQSKLEEKAKKTQAELTTKGNAFQREVSEYQQKAATMSAQERQTTEERLARKQEELGKFNQNANQSFAKDEADEQEKLYNKVSDYLKTYAADKGFKMVLTYSRGNPNVLFADKSLDVTTEVLSGLNSAYDKEKKK